MCTECDKIFIQSMNSSCILYSLASFHYQLNVVQRIKSISDSPDIDPISLEWLLLLKLVLLLLLILSIVGALCVCPNFSNVSWSSLQYNEPPSRNANSSPANQIRWQSMWLMIQMNPASNDKFALWLIICNYLALMVADTPNSENNQYGIFSF